MKKYKKYIILIIVVVVILIGWYLVEFVYFSSDPESKLSCKFLVRVATDTMEPDLKKWRVVWVNKCFTDEDLVAGNVVVFKDERGTMIMRYFLKFEGDKIDLVRDKNNDIPDISIERSQVRGVININ